jgi:hypothetical protein
MRQKKNGNIINKQGHSRMVALSRQYKAAVAMVWDSRRYRKRLSPLPNFIVRKKNVGSKPGFFEDNAHCQHLKNHT